MKVALLLQCPHCHVVNNRHAGVGDALPVDGDLTLCWSCRRIAAFVVTATSMSLRFLTEAEQRYCASDPDVQFAIRAADEAVDAEAATKRRENLS